MHLPGRLEQASARKRGDGRAGSRNPDLAAQPRVRGDRDCRQRARRRRRDGASLPPARRLPEHAGRAGPAAGRSLVVQPTRSAGAAGALSPSAGHARGRCALRRLRAVGAPGRGGRSVRRPPYGPRRVRVGMGGSRDGPLTAARHVRCASGRTIDGAAGTGWRVLPVLQPRHRHPPGTDRARAAARCHRSRHRTQIHGEAVSERENDGRGRLAARRNHARARQSRFQTDRADGRRGRFRGRRRRADRGHRLGRAGLTRMRAGPSPRVIPATETRRLTGSAGDGNMPSVSRQWQERHDSRTGGVGRSGSHERHAVLPG